MMYLFKKITRDILKNKTFVFLLLLLSAFTSFMYFFVHFSIDGNMKILNSLSGLSENQLLYQNALKSNMILAQNFLIVLTGLTAFVFAMFFYRFYKSNGKQIGCLRSLGYKNYILKGYFASFTALLSLIGGAVGIISGYFVSDILINANTQTYSVTGLIKSLNLSSINIGLFVPMSIFCVITFLSYSFIERMEVGNLISGINNKQRFSWVFMLINNFTKVLPVKNKFPYRIALRKPFSIVLIITAVMGFTVMFIMGYSVNLSSQKVFSSQTVGHKYLYDTYFPEYKIEGEEKINALYYLSSEGIVKFQNGKHAEQQIIGIEQNDDILALNNKSGELLNALTEAACYISPALGELYGFRVGDEITLMIDNQNYPVTVQDIAVNAKSKAIYISKTKLAQILNLPPNTYNGVLSMDKLFENEGMTTTHEQKIQELDKASVSGRTSGVINQIIGCVVGCILNAYKLSLTQQLEREFK